MVEGSPIRVVFDFFNSLAYRQDGAADEEVASWQLPYDAVEVLRELKQVADCYVYFSDEESKQRDCAKILALTYPEVFAE